MRLVLQKAGMILGLAAFGLLLLGPAPATASGSSTSAFLSDVQSARAQHGLPPLRMTSKLTGVAAGHTSWMAREQQLVHNSKLTSEITDWQEIGENVGVGGDEQSVANAFMASAEHRDNILNPRYTEIGVATATGSDGRLWVTEDFERPFATAPVAKPHHHRTGTTPTTSHTHVAAPARPVVRHTTKPATASPTIEAAQRAAVVMDLTAAEAQTTAPNSAAGPTSSDVVSPWWSIAGVAVAPFWASGRGRRLARRTFAPASGRTAVPVAAALLSGPLAVVTVVLGWVAGLAWWELLLAAFLVPNAAFVCLLVAGVVVSGRRERREQAAAHVVRLVDTQNRPESDAAELPQTPLRGDPWDLELLGSSLGSSRMRAALEARQLQIALQPIIDLNTGAIVSVEALARFPDTRPPNEWFAEAHALGFGADLELQALETAFAMVNELPGDVRLAVNVSPKVTLDPRLSETLLRSGIPMERVILEITEHTAVAHYPSVRDALLPLRGSGVRLAVDDAGAGYASFAHVLQLRPEIIKLDRSLVFGIDRDPAARAFVTGVVLLALELGASVVAEGVETEAQRVQLEALGIDYVQGFLLASPTTDASEWRSWAERTWAVGSTADVTDPLDTIRITREIHV